MLEGFFIVQSPNCLRHPRSYSSSFSSSDSARDFGSICFDQLINLQYERRISAWLTHLTSDTKTAALCGLYARIKRIAVDAGGDPSSPTIKLSFPSPGVATPRTEDAPALRIAMPDGFQLDFAPSNPLSLGSTLSVTATRTNNGRRKNDWTFRFEPRGWRRTNSLLSDDEIRECLKPEGH
jgi:hypothetical protein